MKNKTLTKTLSAILAVVMVFCSAPLSGFVGLKFPELKMPDWFDFTIKASAETYSGSCGDNVNWSFDTETGVLDITGTGYMDNYQDNYDAPWYQYSSLIKNVVIADGVTSVCSYAFADYNNLESITIPNGMSEIPGFAFMGCQNLKSVTIPKSVTSIEADAFNGCSSLTDVYYSGSENTWNRIAIESGNECLTNATLYFICEHEYSFVTTEEPTCTETGESAYMCILCEDIIYTEMIPETEHTPGYEAEENREDETCTETGSYDSVVYCSVCNEEVSREKVVLDALGHTSGDEVIENEFPATEYQKGSYDSVVYCLTCNEELSRETFVIDRSGKCGENVYWTLNEETGVLDITGTGDMYYYESYPWADVGHLIKELVVHDGVTGVGGCIFDRNCDSVSITLPESVKTINMQMFSEQYTTANLYYTGSLDSWCDINFVSGNYVQSYCIENFYISNVLVEEIVVPETVSKIKDFTFCGMQGIKSVTLHENIESIGTWAFSETGIKSIEIPDSVTYINGAFSGCANLESVKLPEGLSKIDFGMFSFCISLRSIEIPDSVTKIDHMAFSYCQSLESIYIGKNVTYIADGAFEKCTALTDVYYKSSEEKWNEIDIDYSGNEYLLNATIHFHECDYISECVMQPTCTQTGEMKFTCTVCGDVITEEIPAPGHTEMDEVEENRKDATCTEKGSYDSVVYCSVCDAELLRKTVIVDAPGHTATEAVEENRKDATCTEKGSYDSVVYCSVCDAEVSRETVILKALGHTKGEKITENQVEPVYEKRGSYDLVEYCTECNEEISRKTVYIPALVEALLSFKISNGVATVTECVTSASGEIVIPSIINDYPVTCIGSYAFEGCTGLTAIEIPDSVTSIGYSAFSGCTGLKELTMPASANIYNSEYTFYNCTNIEKVTLTKGTGTMQDYAAYSYYDGTYYGYTPWYISRNTIKEIVIEDGVTNIGKNAFHYCSGLASVTIADSVTSIGEYAFAGCEKIAEITISDSIISVGSSAFEGCKGLTEVAIPDSVTSIGEYAFAGCENIAEITIPESVTSIGSGAFRGCSSLVRVYYTGNIESWCNIIFDKWDATPMYHAQRIYFNNIPVTEIIIPDTVTEIKDHAFYGFKEVTSLEIPDSVESIGQYAFTNCKKISTISIPRKVTSIGYKAFANCIGLETITISESVTDLGSGAFLYCDNLAKVYYEGSVEDWHNITFETNAIEGYTSNPMYYATKLYVYGELLENLIIPEGTTAIKSVPFYSLECLKTVTIPMSVITIHQNAFRYCSRIETVYFEGTESQWDEIVIYDGNDCLKTAEKTFLDNSHTHSYNSSVTTEPTCTEAGVKTFRCVCGDTYTEIVPATGHMWGSWMVVTEPTEATDGLKVRVCNVCTDAFEREIIPATGSEPGDVPVTSITITVTDADGKVIKEEVISGDLEKYSLDGVADGEYTVTVKKETYATRTYMVSATNGEVSLEFKLNKNGDITGDGKVNTIDVARANSHAKGVSVISGYDFACVDINGDGKVNTIDVARINSHAKGVTTLW